MRWLCWVVFTIMSGIWVAASKILRQDWTGLFEKFGVWTPFLWFLHNQIIGSFHAKTTTFQKSWQVTPSDFAHIHTVCSSIGRMDTQKKSVAYSLQFWKYSSSKIWPDPPFLAVARRVIDLSDLWPAFIPVCNKIQRSKLLPGVISSHILRIWSQKHCNLLSFYARGT